jgi:hypothetical protein
MSVYNYTSFLSRFTIKGKTMRPQLTGKYMTNMTKRSHIYCPCPVLGSLLFVSFTKAEIVKISPRKPYSVEAIESTKK